MYSKKINQLATNLNPQETDLLPIGDAETGQLKTTTFGSVSGITGDGVISGGIVTWTGTGLIFNISACTYILNGIRYSSPFSTKTLAAADPTNPRIDVFAVNTSGQVEVIQGTPASNPIEPEGDTPTTLGLTNVTINAGATTPNGVTKDMIYDENVESWTKTQSVTGSFDYNDTAFPYTGSKALLVTMSAGFADFRFSKATAMNITNFQSLQFAIRLNTAWTSNTSLSVQFYNGTTLITNTYQITSTNTVGFNRNLAGTYQLITIPLNGTLLKFTQNTFTAVRIYTFNAAATYRFDTIALNGGINNPSGTTSSKSFGFVNGSTGTATATTATDTLNIVGTGLATTSATGKTLTIAVPSPTITLSGDISGTGTTAITTTIGANKVTNAMLAQIATASFLGRVTTATGNVETLTGTQATTLLNVFTSSLKGLAPASGGGTTNFLRADGTWAAAGGSMAIGGSITSATAGSVLFAGTSGVLQQDNANFFWDDSNNRLGIGTTSPNFPLTLDKSSSYTLGLLNSNIGTIGQYTGLTFGYTGTSYQKGALYFISKSSNGVGNLIFALNNTEDSSNVSTSNERMRLTSGGNLLVGTTTDSGEKLQVSGTMKVTGASTFGGNVVLGTTALSGGGAAQWITTNGTSYGGGLISSVSGVVKAYYYYDNNANAALVQGIAGVGVQLWANAAVALSIATTGAATFSSTVTAVSSITGSQFAASNTNGITLSDNAVGGFLSYGFNSGRTNAAGHNFYNGISTELMRITSSGNVGIGTTSPNYKLDVNGTFRSQGDAYASTKAWVGTNETTSPGALTVYSTSAANQIRIVGTTPATVYTDIFGSGTPTIVGAVGGVSTTNNFVTGTVVGDFVVTNQLTTKRLYCVSNTGGVYLATNATSWTANSDITLKNINSYITNAVDKLMNLSVINYHLKDDITKKEQIGLIAQEVKQVFPEIIEESEIGILGLRYTEIIPILVKAIQELKNEINNLKNK